MSIRLNEVRAPHPPRAVPANTATAKPQAAPVGEEVTPFARVLRGIGHEVARGESAVRGALHAGGNLGASELLALQAGVYRYSEAVDLAAKLVDRASSGIKTVIQGQ